MSKFSRTAPHETFQFPSLNGHWHRRQLTKSLGCQRCAFHSVCGGLQVEAAVFDCMTYCRCENQSTCDNVCPRNAAHHVARSHEVKGLEFGNVKEAPAIAVPPLPMMVPMIFHSSSRNAAARVSVAALSLYEMFSKVDGSLRFATRQDLLAHYKLADNATIILSGTHEDFLIERWWNLANRQAVIRGLIDLGITLVTTPNFSLFGDVPRLDNLFNMKRIALAWSEMQREGMPCALHLNARTDRDFERWTEFLLDHPEISHIAFEFGTGAGSRNRIGWHVEQLTTLARQVPGPLHLIVRGGISVLRGLAGAFAGVTFIDTSVFMKTQHRQRLIVNGHRLTSEASPTPEGAYIDDLLDYNVAVSKAYVESISVQ